MTERTIPLLTGPGLDGDQNMIPYLMGFQPCGPYTPCEAGHEMPKKGCAGCRVRWPDVEDI